MSPTVAAPSATAAAVVAAPGQARVIRLPAPQPAPGEVLVRVEGCGLCASSLPVWEGRPWFDYPLPPGAPGHEAWGVEVASGQRVALLAQSAFAEYVAVRPELLVSLPRELDGRPFPGEAVGCALNVFARSGIRTGDEVAVVGAGFLGLLLVQLAVGAGARVAVFSGRSTGLELARSFGAETPAGAIDESCDVAIEAAGVQRTLDLAARLPRVRGRLVVAGYHQDGPRTVDLQSWNWRGIEVVNAHERDPAVVRRGVEAAARAAAAGRLDLRPLLTHTFSLASLGEGFELLRTRPEGFVKAVVTAR